MSANAYELLALCMRYVFAALMVLILVRAWRITLVDGHRATKLRRLSPETGIIGEFLVMDGHERSRNGMRYPVILEGSIGSGRRADIRLRSSSVKSSHAVFHMTEDGLYIRGRARCKLRDGFGRSVKELTLRDGDLITIGSVRLMLVFSGTDAPRRMPVEHIEHAHVRPERAQRVPPVIEPGISRGGDDLFEVADNIDDRDLPSVRSARERQRAPERDGEDPSDVFYDFDEYDDC